MASTSRRLRLRPNRNPNTKNRKKPRLEDKKKPSSISLLPLVSLLPPPPPPPPPLSSASSSSSSISSTKKTPLLGQIQVNSLHSLASSPPPLPEHSHFVNGWGYLVAKWYHNHPYESLKTGQGPSPLVHLLYDCIKPIPNLILLRYSTPSHSSMHLITRIRLASID